MDKIFNSNDDKVIFESERCFVRAFKDNDIDDFMLYRNDLDWMKYQGFKGLTREEYEKALLNEKLIEEGVQLAIIRKSDKGLIGDLYLMKENDSFWIGFTINPLFKRQGYTYEIVSSMIFWIKQQGKFKIMASAEPENISSVRLLEKMDFVQVEEEDGLLIYALNLD